MAISQVTTESECHPLMVTFVESSAGEMIEEIWNTEFTWYIYIVYHIEFKGHIGLIWLHLYFINYNILRDV